MVESVDTLAELVLNKRQKLQAISRKLRIDRGDHLYRSGTVMWKCWFKSSCSDHNMLGPEALLALQSETFFGEYLNPRGKKDA